MTARWDEAVTRCRATLEPCVLVTVLGTSGSAPRAPGAKMVVTARTTHDSIGGGRLELLATERARDMLAEPGGPAQQLEHFPLGQAAKQCCGGAVSVLLERITPALTTVVLFGAGHVGQALARILAELPFHLIWVDSRPERFPADPPANQQQLRVDDPTTVIATLPEGARSLVMTHDHDLDLRIVQALLERASDAPVGLIASAVKAARFRLRLAAAGVSDAALCRLQAPVGLPEVGGKEPMAVAVSVAAQLLQDCHPATRQDAPRPGRSDGLPWPALREASAALRSPSSADPGRPEDGAAAEDTERSA